MFHDRPRRQPHKEGDLNSAEELSVRQEQVARKLEQKHSNQECLNRILADFKSLSAPSETVGRSLSEMLADTECLFDLPISLTVRRMALLQQMASCSREDSVHLLREELATSESLIRKSPKSYGVWTHRTWCVSELEKLLIDDPTESLWTRELALCRKLLTEYDARNFHCWKYRASVAQNIIEASSEDFSHLRSDSMDLCSALLRSDITNYSAWRLRSSCVLESLSDHTANREALLDTEMQLLRDAYFTDPNDESIWLYHEWVYAQLPLVFPDDITWGKFRSEELESLNELLSLEPSSKYALLAKESYMSSDKSEHLGSRASMQILCDADPMRKKLYAMLMGDS